MIPIACSLNDGEARGRWLDWQALARSRRQVERSDQSLKLHFVADDTTRAVLDRLVLAESLCCGFVDWQLEDLGDELLLTLSGPANGVTAMAEAFLLET